MLSLRFPMCYRTRPHTYRSRLISGPAEEACSVSTSSNIFSPHRWGFRIPSPTANRTTIVGQTAGGSEHFATSAGANGRRQLVSPISHCLKLLSNLQLKIYITRWRLLLQFYPTWIIRTVVFVFVLFWFFFQSLCKAFHGIYHQLISNSYFCWSVFFFPPEPAFIVLETCAQPLKKKSK